MVGVSPSLISQIERGQSQPSVATLFALAESLEVPVDAFFVKDAPAAGTEPEAPATPVVLAEPDRLAEDGDAVSALRGAPRRPFGDQHRGRSPLGAADA